MGIVLLNSSPLSSTGCWGYTMTAGLTKQTPLQTKGLIRPQPRGVCVVCGRRKKARASVFCPRPLYRAPGCRGIHTAWLLCCMIYFFSRLTQNLFLSPGTDGSNCSVCLLNFINSPDQQTEHA